MSKFGLQPSTVKPLQKRQELSQLLIEHQRPMGLKYQDKKENKPPEKLYLKSNPKPKDSRTFTKDDILTRIKKLNAQSKVANEANHIRYKSSLNQNGTRNNSLTFHQILKEYSQKSNSSRLNQNLLNKYGNKEVIYEEPSPFKEASVIRATSAQDRANISFEQKFYPSKEKKVEMNHLLLDLQQKSRKFRIPQSQYNSRSREEKADASNSYSRTRIKESFFQYKQYTYVQTFNSSNESISNRRTQLNSADQIISQTSNKLAVQMKENKSQNNNLGRYSQQQGYLTDKQILSGNTAKIKTVNIEQLQKSLENMCSLSSQQLNLMKQTKISLVPSCNIFRKSVNRCISADINLLPKGDISQNDISKNVAADGQGQIYELTCEDEEVKIDDCFPVARFQEQSDNNNDDDNNVFDSNTIGYLCDRERHYLPDPHYLSGKQCDMTWTMRAILVDWMMEVSCEYHLKRETFYLASYYVDRHLSREVVVKDQLQLIGLTSMFMASKIEEIQPQKASSFARSADYGYSVDQILSCELRILNASRWEVNPPTYNMWVNWYTGQWDLYYRRRDIAWCGFKESREDSFQLFKKLSQLIDCAVLDIETLQYQPRTIVASFMYLVIALQLRVFDDDMIDEFRKCSLFLLDQSNEFNVIFGDFISTTFGFYLQDLLPSIQYASTFLRLQVSYDAPPGAATLTNTPMESHYEEFLSFQCHFPQNLQFVKKRQKDSTW